MKQRVCLLFFLLLGGYLGMVAQPAMNNDRLIDILQKEGLRYEGENGSWLIYYEDRILLILTDESRNRMRIFTPIISEEDIGPTEMRRMLTANFHEALDAKYSLSEGFVISVFTHPFRELSCTQLLDAMQQVDQLARTFGTTYTSAVPFTTPPSRSGKQPIQEPVLEKKS